jgi:hypothetical protein
MSKEKIHFAQRVQVRLVPKDNATNGAFNHERMKVQAETNSPLRMLSIDKSVFKKTEQEKQNLKLAKLQHKVDLLNGK